MQTLLPLIIEEAQILVSKLMEKTESDKHFQLGKVLQNLTFDVIACVVLGHSIQAQSTPDGQGVNGPKGVVTAFRGVQHNFFERGSILPRNFSLMRILKLSYYER